jgi:hypothetical protein
MTPTRNFGRHLGMPGRGAVSQTVPRAFTQIGQVSR